MIVPACGNCSIAARTTFSAVSPVESLSTSMRRVSAVDSGTSGRSIAPPMRRQKKLASGPRRDEVVAREEGDEPQAGLLDGLSAALEPVDQGDDASHLVACLAQLRRRLERGTAGRHHVLEQDDARPR